MRKLLRILHSSSGATLTNTIIGATMLSGLAILVTQGITTQRTQNIKLNAGSSCQAATKNSMDMLKTIDNNSQGSVNFTPSRWRNLGTNAVETDFDPTDDYASRFNFKLIWDDTNAVLNTEPVGALAPPNMVVGVDQLVFTAPFNDGACAAPCSTENTAYNEASRGTAANAILNYQLLNSATTRLAYLYNVDGDYCNLDEGLRVDNDPFFQAALGINLVQAAAGLSGFQQMNARIRRVNLLTGDVDCGDQGAFRPIPAGGTGGTNSLSPYGLQLTLTTLVQDNDGNVKGCTLRNSFSQAPLNSTPTVNSPTITPVDPTTQPNPGTPEFCGTGPSVLGAGDETSPQVDVLFSGSGEGITLFCRVEYMDSNRGGVGDPGYAYADSGWFACKVPIQGFEAGVDPSAIDPDDLDGTLINNAGDRAQIGIENIRGPTTNSGGLRFSNLPEGKFTISTFAVDASQTASTIRSTNFYVDLMRPLGTTGISPDAGGVIGQFDDPNVRLYELRAQFPFVHSSNINGLVNNIRSLYRSNNKIYQCKPGKAVFGMSGYEEIYPITDGGVRWYFGPSDVTDANLNTMLQYTPAEVAAFNAATAAGHPVKTHDKEMIIDPNGGTCTETRCEGPILDDSSYSGEWVAIGLPKDECGFGFSQNTSRRPWVVDMEHKPEVPVAAQDETGGINVVVESGSPFVTKDRPSFTYQFSGSKPKHKIGKATGIQQLPHLYLCEIAGPPSGGQEAPGNTTKQIYTYSQNFDVYNTFGVPAATYDPANGIFDLIYNSISDTTTGTCIQADFQNSCVQDPSGELGVAVIDACGRVLGDQTLYEVRGYSNYPTVPSEQDGCRDIDCSPGFYCDKSGAEIGTCKHPAEVNWSGVGNNRSSYPGVNCSGSTCATVPECGTNNDCGNDISPSTCSGQSVACTEGGNTNDDIGPSSGVSYTIGGTHPDCLTNAQKTSYQSYVNPPASFSCQYTSSQGDACSFVEVENNVHNRHSLTGHSPQEVCPPIGSQYDWDNGSDSSSCSDYDSASGCSATIGMNCSTPGQIQYCDSGEGATQSYSWSLVSTDGTCSMTASTCSGTYDQEFWSGEATVSDCLLSAGGHSCPMSCSNFSDLNRLCCDTTSADSYRCVCDGTITTGGLSCPGSAGDCSSVATGAACNSIGELGDEVTCDDGSNVYTYRCGRTCNTPTKTCSLANTTPPWLDHSNNVNLTFSGACDVNFGTCTAPDNSSSGAGPANLACPNLNPLADICRTVSCSDDEAKYCSGVSFTLTPPACSAGPNLSCTGTTTPNCSHLPGYTLLNQSVAQCLANGFDSCLSASTSCIGREYTCGANVACSANEINYANLAACQAVHGSGQCTSLLSGQACGKGCHPSVANQSTSEAGCNGSGNYGCVRLHPSIAGVNNWCATTCDSSSGEMTFDSQAACTTATGSASCPTRTVVDSSASLAPKTAYCEGSTDCPTGEIKYTNLYQCLSDNTWDISKCSINKRSGTCPAIESCGGNTVYYQDDLSCNGSNVTAGSMVSDSCCSGNADCKYIQDYTYIDDDSGANRSLKVFCAGAPSTSGTCGGFESAKSINSEVTILYSSVTSLEDFNTCQSRCKAECESAGSAKCSVSWADTPLGQLAGTMRTCICSGGTSTSNEVPWDYTPTKKGAVAACSAGPSVSPGVAVWTSDKCASTPTDWRVKGSAVFTEKSCGGIKPVDSNFCYEDTFSVPGVPVHQVVAYNADGTADYVGSGSIGQWVFYYEAESGVKFLKTAEVLCEPDSAPPASSCQAYACSAAEAGCWEIVSSNTDMGNINAAGHPTENCSGDCPGGVEPVNGDACTVGQTADHEWKHGTRFWACTDSCSATPSTCEWDVSTMGELCSSAADCASYGKDSRFGYDSAVSDGDSCTSGDAPRTWPSMTENFGGVPYTRQESRAICECNNDPCVTNPGSCMWETTATSGIDLNNSGCSWQGSDCSQLGFHRICCSDDPDALVVPPACNHPSKVIDPIPVRCIHR